MSEIRQQQLEKQIKDEYELLGDAESHYMFSSDPKERMRLKRDIEEAKARIAELEAEYSRIAGPTGQAAPVGSTTSSAQSAKFTITPPERAKVRDYLTSRFSLSELATLAFDLGVDDKLPPHSALTEYAMQLIGQCQRTEQLRDLLELAVSQRPDPEITKILQTHR